MKEIIKKLYDNTDKYNESAVNEIRKYKGEINDYLIEELEELINEYGNNEDIPIAFDYIVFILAEFREKRSFQVIMDYVEKQDNLFKNVIGVFDKLPSIIVSVFDGDYERINKCIKNKNINHSTREQLINVYEYFYNEGMVSKEEVISYLKKISNMFNDDGGMNARVVSIICECHIFEMMDFVRGLFERGVVDKRYIGGYDDFVDIIFDFDDKKEKVTLITDIKIQFPWWAYFEVCPTTNKSTGEYGSDIQNFLKKTDVVSNKVGRNDPCPCGSGKKYKKCCMEKMDNSLPYQDFIDKSLSRYPKESDNENSFYKYFKQEYIEIDKLLYKALKNKIIPLNIERNINKENNIDYEYLNEAFPLIKEVVYNNNFKTIRDYDENVSIHFGILAFFSKYSEIIMNKGEKYVDELKKLVDFFYDNFDLNDDNESIFLDRLNTCYVFTGKLDDGIEYFEDRLINNPNCKYYLYLYLFDEYFLALGNSAVSKINEKINEEKDTKLKSDLENLLIDFLDNRR